MLSEEEINVLNEEENNVLNEEENNAAFEESNTESIKREETPGIDQFERTPPESTGSGKPRYKKSGKPFAAICFTVVIGCAALGFGISAGSFALNRIYGSQPQAAATVSNKIFAAAKTDTNSAINLSSISSMFDAIDNSVVSINTTVQQVGYFNQIQTGQGAGSGIVFKEDTNYIYIVTNYHVINQATNCTVSFDDKTQITANYVGGDQGADIAVIKVKKSDLSKAGVSNYKLAVFAKSTDVRVGDPVVAVGNAYGEGKSATFGIVSAVGRTITDDGGQTINVIQTDAAINPGNSGGALVESDGDVIGITSAKLVSNGVEGMGYAIPSDNVVILINQIMSASTTVAEKPMLGVSTIDITQSMAKQYGVPVGVYISDVSSGSTADNMGIQPGDIITDFNGASVTTGAQLTDAISKTKVGDKVTATIVRVSQSRFYNTNSQTIVLSGTMRQAASGTDF